MVEIVGTGGEGGILLPPLPASADEPYTSAIIPCVLAGYKRIPTQARVSIVPLIHCGSHENGITGISADLDGYACLSLSKGVRRQQTVTARIAPWPKH
jgi:hypothetical protein